MTELLPLLASGLAETRAANVAMLAGFIDRVRAVPWTEAARQEDVEMEAALAPLFAPVPTRDSDLPAVVSPCA